MKAIRKVLLIVLMLAFAPPTFGQQKPVTVKGHTVGEPGTVNCSAEYQRQIGIISSGFHSPYLRQIEAKERAAADKEFAECNLGNWTAGIGEKTPGSLTYKAGKLVKIKIDLESRYDEPLTGEGVLLDVREKFGKPTDTSYEDMINGFGARWRNYFYSWDLPDAYVSLFLDGKPQSEPELLGFLEVMTPEEHAAENAETAAKRKNVLDAPAEASTALNHKLSIQSTPDGADIEVDGSFVGSTPSALELAPGEHTVVVSKKGYEPWQRKVKMVGSDIKANV
jgi:hypothetical protein